MHSLELKKEKKSIFSEVTFVIPTKGRESELKQLLNYFSANKLPSPIVILETGNICSNFIHQYDENLNIHLESFSEKVNFVKKLLIASKHIKTPYVCLCTDDDIVLIECVIKCVEFLKKNTDYTACQGGHCLFEQIDKKVNILDYLWKSPSLESSYPLKRLSALFQSYEPICWAVYPKNIFTLIFKKLNKYKNIGDVFLELIWSTTSVLQGKTKRLTDIYCLRRSDHIHHPGHSFFYFLNSSNTFFKSYSIYKKYLLKNLSHPKISNARIKYILDLIHAKYFCIEFDKEKTRIAIDRLIENRHFTIYSKKIFNAIKVTPPEFNQEDSRMFEVGDLKYHCSSSYLQSYHELITPNNESLIEMLNHISSYFLNMTPSHH